MENALQEFRAVLARAGLMPDQIIPDGKLHRCQVEGRPHGRDGAYVFHGDAYPNGWFQNFATGEIDKWRPERDTPNHPRTPEERERLRKFVQDQQVLRQKEIADGQRTARARAQKILKGLPQAPADHPYLQKKGVAAAPGVRLAPVGNLVIPILGEDGNPMSLQFVSTNGTKRFLKHGEIQGGFFAIRGAQDKPLHIAEGYATAATIHAATGATVLVAFNAGNLPHVATLARKTYPDRPIVMCADNDHETYARLERLGKTPKNPGLEQATAAALAIGATLAVPTFAAPQGKSDFNDLAQAEGLQAVTACIQNARTPVAPTVEPQLVAPIQSQQSTPAPDTPKQPLSPDQLLDHVLSNLGDTAWYKGLLEFKKSIYPKTDLGLEAKAALETEKDVIRQIQTILSTLDMPTQTPAALQFKKDLLAQSPDLVKALKAIGLIAQSSAQLFAVTFLAQPFLEQYRQQSPSPAQPQNTDDFKKDYVIYQLNNGNTFYQHTSGIHAFEVDKNAVPHLLSLGQDPETKARNWILEEQKPFDATVTTPAAAMIDIKRRLDSYTKNHEWNVKKNDDGSKDYALSGNVFMIRQSEYGVCTLFTKSRLTNKHTGKMETNWTPAQKSLSGDSEQNIVKAMIETLVRMQALDNRPLRPNEVIKGTVDYSHPQELRGKNYIQVRVAKDNGKSALRYIDYNPAVTYLGGQEITAKKELNGEMSIYGPGVTRTQPASSPSPNSPIAPSAAKPQPSMRMSA